MEILSSIPLEVAILLAGAAVAGFVFFILIGREDAREARETLSQVEGYDLSLIHI